MIFGIPVTGSTMLVVGILLFLITAFQVLAGMRVIKLGKVHRQVHRWTAYVIIGLAALHGLLGIAFATGWSIL
jgi:hypothetical protein